MATQDQFLHTIWQIIDGVDVGVANKKALALILLVRAAGTSPHRLRQGEVSFSMPMVRSGAISHECGTSSPMRFGDSSSVTVASKGQDHLSQSQ